MEYIPPLGSVDPDAAYVDVNKATGTPGSPVPAAAIEHPMREILAVIAAAGLTPDSGDLTQLAQAIEALVGSENFLGVASNLSDLQSLPTALTNLGFAQSLSASGYEKLPSGLIRVWDNVQLAATHTANTEVSVAITFPQSFPHACHFVLPVISLGWNTTGYSNCLAENWTQTGCTLKYVSGSSGGAAKVGYLAWGY